MSSAIDERLGDGASLPRGWRWVRLGQLGSDGDAFADGPFGSRLKTEHYVETGARVVRLQNIGRGTFLDTDKAFVSMKYFQGLLRHGVRPGDVIVAALGDGARPAGRACLIPEGFGPGLVKADCFRIRLPSDGIDAQYLVHFLNAPQVLGHVADLMRGATRPRFTLAMLRELPVAVPLLSEQKRISAVLQNQMAAVKRARAAAEARLNAARAIPAACLRAVFSTPDAAQWPRVRVGDVCQLLASRSIANSGDTAVQAITTACLTEVGFQAAGVKSATMWASDARECRVLIGEILVARSNTAELVGRATMFTGDPPGAVASDLTIRVRPGTHVVPAFASAFLSFLHVTGYWKERAGGASGSMKKITRAQIENQTLPLPSREVQERVAGVLASQLTETDRVCQALETELCAVDALPAALLQEAFSGKL